MAQADGLICITVTCVSFLGLAELIAQNSILIPPNEEMQTIHVCPRGIKLKELHCSGLR